MTTENQRGQRKTAANMGLAKWRVTCFYKTFVVNQTVVHLMKFSVEMPPLRQAQNRVCPE